MRGTDHGMRENTRAAESCPRDLQNGRSGRRRAGHAYERGRNTAGSLFMTRWLIVDGYADRHRGDMPVRAMVDVLRVVRPGRSVGRRTRRLVARVRRTHGQRRLRITIMGIRKQDLERVRGKGDHRYETHNPPEDSMHAEHAGD